MSALNDDLPLYGHCIPVPFEEYYARKNDESEADYYERVVE